jgi:hypothetical protein
MANFIEHLTAKRNGNANEAMLPSANMVTVTDRKPVVETGNINEIAYKIAGRNNGDPMALNNSLDLVKSGQIVDENNNESRRREVVESIDRKIDDLRDEITGHKAEIAKIEQVVITDLEKEIEDQKQKIGLIRNSARDNKYNRNKFNLILIWVGFIAGFLYLYLFYVSAIHSALFRNVANELARAGQNNIGALLNNVFNVSAFKEFNIHWLAPVVFLVFAVILHFALEIKSKAVKWPSVCGVILFVLIADGLLAYAIENNNHTVSKLMGLSDGTWVFYKSFVFYLVLFFGFFTSMGWSLTLHKLANEFETANPERKADEEIRGIEKTLRQLYFEKGTEGTTKIENINAINLLEDKIKSLEKSKTNVHYSLVDLEKNVDDFFNGWLSYLNGLKSDKLIKSECETIYRQFKSENFNRQATA